MSHPSTPFDSAPAPNPFATAVQMLHQSSELEHWTPPSVFSVTPAASCLALEPELVIAVGSATNNRRFFYFEGLYDEFDARGGDDAVVLKSFIKALTFRRCKAVELLQSILQKLFRNPMLDAEDWEDLSSIVADTASKPLLELLLKRTEGVCQRTTFYSHVMRCATEQFATPDMQLVMRVVDEMVLVGAAWADATMYHILGGFARMKRVPFEALIHLVTVWKASKEGSASKSKDSSECAEARPLVDPSIVSRIVAICERAMGSDVAHALTLLNLAGNKEEWYRCVSLVAPPIDFHKPPASEDCVYYLIDPLSIDIGLLGEPLPHSYYLFLFSALRSLCEKAESHPENHVIFTSKIFPLRALFEKYPTSYAAVPPDVELNIRSPDCCAPQTDESSNQATTSPTSAQNGSSSNVLATSLPPNGGISQMILFAQCATRLSCPVGRSMRVLCSNPYVIKELTPLTNKYPSSWFCICDRVCSRSGSAPRRRHGSGDTTPHSMDVAKNHIGSDGTRENVA